MALVKIWNSDDFVFSFVHMIFSDTSSFHLYIHDLHPFSFQGSSAWFKYIATYCKLTENKLDENFRRYAINAFSKFYIHLRAHYGKYFDTSRFHCTRSLTQSIQWRLGNQWDGSCFDIIEKFSKMSQPRANLYRYTQGFTLGITPKGYTVHTYGIIARTWIEKQTSLETFTNLGYIKIWCKHRHCDRMGLLDSIDHSRSANKTPFSIGTSVAAFMDFHVITRNKITLIGNMNYSRSAIPIFSAYRIRWSIPCIHYIIRTTWVNRNFTFEWAWASNETYGSFFSFAYQMGDVP